MTDHHRDFSFTTLSSIDPNDIPLKTSDFESSLESYSNLFDKDRHNFSASSEISFANHNDEQFDKNPSSTVDHNRTFTKEISRTIINAFTGKPISPNPWRKLCTKNVHHRTETHIAIPIELSSPVTHLNQEKSMEQISTSNDHMFCLATPQGQFNNRIVTRQSRRYVYFSTYAYMIFDAFINKFLIF
jgi:hypothetical protein